MENVSERGLRIAQEIAHRTTCGHYRLVLNEKRLPRVTGSKIGGIPYWPVGMEYPTDEDGKPMMLLMQINCTEAGFQAPLPARGMLQWFISVNPDKMYGCRGNFDDGGQGCRIVYHATVGDSVATPHVPTHATVEEHLSPVKRETAIDVEPGQTAMGVSDGRFNNLFFEIVKEITGVDRCDMRWYEYLDNNDCLYMEQHLGMARPCHQVLGYPVYSQDETRRDIERHDTLLLQLDSQFSTTDGKPLVMWGDMGSGFVFVNRDDLAALDFTRPYYCWDCG